MTAPDRIIVRWTTSGKATVATPALHGPIAETAGVYVLEPRATPAPAAIREAALREAADYIEHAPVGTRFQDRDAILSLIPKEKPHDR